jgi:long-chain acyl-CoA synthetase
LLAYESNVPVIPAYIQGTYQALPAGKVVPKATQVRVRFGQPICMDKYRAGGSLSAKDELYRRIATEVRDNIERLASGAPE